MKPRIELRFFRFSNSAFAVTVVSMEVSGSSFQSVNKSGYAARRWQCRVFVAGTAVKNSPGDSDRTGFFVPILRRVFGYL
jgi:hypothetical protein